MKAMGWALVLVMGGSLVPSAPAEAAVAMRTRVVVRAPRAPRLRIVTPVLAPRVRQGHGELHVEVDPERAKVWVDGRYIGRGDTTQVVRSGRHTVRVELENGEDASQTVHVDGGHRTNVKLDLD